MKPGLIATPHGGRRMRMSAVVRKMISPTRVGAIIVALISCQPLSAQPVVSRVHAYEGAHRPGAQLATVFGQAVSKPFPLAFAWTLICEVDGKKVGFLSGCPQVVYLLPGNHQLKFRHRTGNAEGQGTVSFKADAGRVYQVEVEPEAAMRVAYRIKAMPSGFVLTYKDVTPLSYSGIFSGRQNARIDPAVE